MFSTLFCSFFRIVQIHYFITFISNKNLRGEQKELTTCKKIRIKFDLGIQKYVAENFWTLTFHNPWYAHVRVRIRGLQYVNVQSFALVWMSLYLVLSFSRPKMFSQLVRGVIPPFLRFPPLLEIQDIPTFHRSIGKTKVLNNSFTQFVYNFYPQGILILEECLQKWWDADLI